MIGTAKLQLILIFTHPINMDAPPPLGGNKPPLERSLPLN